MSAAAATQTVLQEARAPVRDLLAAVACEMETLTASGQRLQAVIGAHVSGSGSAEQAIEDAQLLDHLLQHYEALAVVMRRLAAVVPLGAEADIAEAIGELPLSGLASRLAGQASDEGIGADSGEFELL